MAKPTPGHAPDRRRVCAAALLAPMAGLSALTAQAAQPHLPAAALRRVAAGVGVYELALSARHRTLYAAVSGGFADDAPGGAVALFAPDSLRPMGRIALPHGGFGLVLDDAHDRLYVTHALHGRVTAIDTASRQIVGVLQLSAPRPDGKRYQLDLRSMVVDAQARRLYVPGLAARDSVLFVIDTAQWKLVRTVQGLGFYPTGLSLDAAGQRLFLGTMAGEIWVVPTAGPDEGQARRLAAPRIEQPVNLLFASDSQALYVADQGDARIRSWQERSLPDFRSRHPGQRIVVLDADTGALRQQWPTLQTPLAMARHAESGDLLVTQRLANTVSRYRSADGKAIAQWTFALSPNSIAMAGQALYVSLKHDPRAKNNASDEVARIAI